MENENENAAFENAEQAIFEAIKAIPETESDNLLAALQTYYEGGGDWVDLREALGKAAEDTFEVTAKGPRETKPETEPQSFANALCALLCQIENEGGGSEAVLQAVANIETAARAAYENAGGETLKAVIEQFDIFQDIG